MAFRNACNTRITNLYAYDYSSGGDSDWNLLKNAACLGASHQSEERYDAPKCHPDTREAVINDIMSWVDSEDLEKRLMWLNGPAGAGKSAVAQTVAEKCDTENRLLGSFFFSRTSAGTRRDDGLKLVPTLAYQLGVSNNLAKDAIIKELEEHEAILTCSMEVQMERLVSNPRNIISTQLSENSHTQHVIIIDGLDECNGIETQTRIVLMIANLLSQSTLNLRILIASRPELEIRNVFNDEGVDPLCVHLTLGSHYNPDKDIDTYLRCEFRNLKRKHTLASLLSRMTDWPPEDDLQTLVKRSSGQFIYASTVIKYIADSRRNPCDSLSTIIRIPLGEAAPYAQLDALYIHVLSVAVANLGGFDPIRLIFQVLLSIKVNDFMDNLHSLSQLLGIPLPQLLLTLADLHAFIEVPDSNGIRNEYAPLKDSTSQCQGVLRFYHASFGDFLKDPARAKNFQITKREAHTSIGKCCLNVILDHESAKYVIAETDPPVLRYAYKAFFYHLSRGNFYRQLVQLFLTKTQKNRELLIKSLLLHTLSSMKYQYYSFLRLFYKFDLTAYNILNSATPLDEEAHIIFGDMVLDVAQHSIMTTKNLDFHVIKAICCTMKRRLRFKITASEIDMCLFYETIENHHGGCEAFIGCVESEQIFQTTWNNLLTKFSHTDRISLKTPYSYLIPPLFEYLLNRIKPSFRFKIFLQKFSQEFESKFFDSLDEGSGEHDFPITNAHSMMRTVESFVKECEAIELITTSCESEYYAPSQDAGVVNPNYPWHYSYNLLELLRLQ